MPQDSPSLLILSPISGSGARTIRFGPDTRRTTVFPFPNRLSSTLRTTRSAATLLCGFALTLTAFLPSVNAQDEENKWEMLGGRSFQAEFVRATEDGVVLKSVDSGAEKEFKFSQLSIASHFKAVKLAKPKAFSKPLPKAPVKEVVQPAAPEFTIDASEIAEYPFPDDPTIEQWIEVLEQANADKNVMVEWHCLPERMQNDIEDLGVEAVGMLSKGQFLQINSLMASVRKIVTEQKDYVFGNKYFQQIPMEKAELENAWPKVAGLIAAFSDSKHWQQDNFTKGNFVPSMSNFVSEVIPHLVSLGDLAPPGTPGINEVPQFKIIKSGKSRATVEMTLMGNTETLQFQKVGKKWVVPSKMNDLRKQVDEAKKALAGFDRSQIGQFSAAISVIIPPVAMLAEAKSQAEFDRHVETILGQAQKMREGLRGGGVGPGGRGPGGRGPGGPSAGGSGSSKGPASTSGGF